MSQFKYFIKFDVCFFSIFPKMKFYSKIASFIIERINTYQTKGYNFEHQMENNEHLSCMNYGKYS